MGNFIDGIAFRAEILGRKVDRAAAVLPATAQAAIYTVAGGRIVLTGIVGEVTTICSATATNLSIVANPTTGTDVAICAVLAIANKEVGTLFGITGTFATALVGANAGAGVLPANYVVIPIGTIDLLTSATNTGAVKWSLTYFPLDDGAYVEAA